MNIDDFRAILTADDVSIGFGDQNDIIKFHFTEKMDALLSDMLADENLKEIRISLGKMTYYPRFSILKKCEL